MNTSKDFKRFSAGGNLPRDRFVDGNNTGVIFLKIQTPFQLGMKLYGSSLLASIFSSIFLIVGNALSGHPIFMAVTQVIAILIIAVNAYAKTWQCGSSDYNRVKFGHMQYNPWKGLIAGLVACIPYAVVALFGVVCKLLGVEAMMIYRMMSFSLLNYINWIVDLETSVKAISLVPFLIAQLPMLVIPLVTFPAYLLGYRQYNVAEHITYRNLPPDKVEEMKRKKAEKENDPRNNKSLFKF